MAAFRAADCLWMAGDRAAPPRPTPAWSSKATARTGDAALARFRIADELADRDPAAARKQWLAIARDYPAHPLADRGAAPAGAPRRPPRATATPAATAARELAPGDRLRRAEALAKDRPLGRGDRRAGKAAAHAAARPGRRARLPDRDDEVPHAPRLPAGRRAAAGHRAAPRRARRRRRRSSTARGRCRASTATTRRSPGTARSSPSSRSRAGRPRRSTCPGGSTTTAGASGRACPRCQATLDRFGASGFADDAAWCLAFAHFMLGNAAEADAALARYGRLPATGVASSDELGARVAYWRARLPTRRGRQTKPKPATATSPGARRSRTTACWRARELAEAGHPEPLQMATKKVIAGARPGTARDPTVARANELLDGGDERRGGRGGEREREGSAQAPRRAEGASGWLLGPVSPRRELRPRVPAGRGPRAGALAADPRADAGTRAFWEAAFPRAYEPLVDDTASRRATPTCSCSRSCARSRAQPPRRVVRRRARPAADDPADQRPGGRRRGRAVLSRHALRPGREHPAGRRFTSARLYNKFGHEVPADRGRLQRGSARDDPLVHHARQATPPTRSSSSSRSRRRASTSSA